MANLVTAKRKLWRSEDPRYIPRENGDGESDNETEMTSVEAGADWRADTDTLQIRQLSIVKEPEQNDSDEYDTDIEMDDEQPDLVQDVEFGTMSYLTACDLLKITPAKRVLEGLATKIMDLKYRSLGPQGAKALSAALQQNSQVEEVNLEENGLEGEGGMYIAEMLKENTFIAHLNISKNRLGSVGAFHFGEMLKINNSLMHLNLSENHFRDTDAEHLAGGIEKNERIVHLDLSHNDFSEEGALHIGRAIGANNSIEHLDLSWNQMRRKGAVTICNGLKRNYCITVMNFSWNGFGYEGSLAVGEMIRGNKYLRELDISNNRINWEGAIHLARGLKENDTLEKLQVGFNPLTMTGCLDILEAVDTPLSVCSHLGFDGIPVNRRIVYMMEGIQKLRCFLMTHGGLLDSEDIFGRRMVLRCDPLKLLIQYLSDKGIRPVDLFRTFDRDNQHRVSREQFVQGLKKAKVPLDDYELERVLNRLDSAKEGKISYQRLVRGVKEQIKVNRAEEKRKQMEEKRMTDEHHKVMGHSGLPPITDLGDGSQSMGRSNTSQSQNSYRPSSSSSTSTVITMLPHSLKSSDPHAVNSKSSIMDESRPSSKTSKVREQSPTLPHVKTLGAATVAKTETKPTKHHDKIHPIGARKKIKK